MSARVETAKIAKLGYVNISVFGGAETNGLGVSQISNQDFAAAIGESLKASGLIIGLSEAAEADARLKVRIARVTRTTFQGEAAVKLETVWTLVPAGETTPIWEQDFVIAHTTSYEKAFSSVTRLRLANEGAARRTIEQALSSLAAFPQG